MFKEKEIDKLVSDCYTGKLKKNYDRFDLEGQIMLVWGLSEDLNTVYEALYEQQPINNDDFANMILGLEKLHSARCEKLFKIFEDCF